MTDETKVCFSCAEVIKAAAVKCRYCLERQPPQPVTVDGVKYPRELGFQKLLEQNMVEAELPSTERTAWPNDRVYFVAGRYVRTRMEPLGGSVRPDNTPPGMIPADCFRSMAWACNADGTPVLDADGNRVDLTSMEIYHRHADLANRRHARGLTEAEAVDLKFAETRATIVEHFLAVAVKFDGFYTAPKDDGKERKQ